MQEPHSYVFTSSSLTGSATSPARSKFTHRRRGKMVQSTSTNYKASDQLINVFESKQQTTTPKDNIVSPHNTVFLLPNLVWGIPKEKLEENSNPPSTSSMSLIPISRILKGIPQSPHFFQLRNYSEFAQHNLKAAWDQTFEETAEQIHDLNAKDFWVSAKKLWKTMGDLQGIGYNVIPLRRRLVEITEIMVKFEKNKLEILALKEKAEDHRMEESRLQSIVRNLQRRAQREEINRVRVLCEVDQMEKSLPKFGVLIGNLAMKPFDVHV